MVVVGIDEVGRGSWAGPLVAGAVILGADIDGLKDSKLLTRLQRETLAQQIRDTALFFSLGWVSPPTIDRLGLGVAVHLAMKRALRPINCKYDKIIIDGNINYLPEVHNSFCLIRADNTVPAVSAASIIAKVARDAYMRGQDRRYPGYGFANHVGYGTKEHRQALESKGICRLHRLCYKPVADVSRKILSQ
jgi:ribonuclease HII